MKWLHRMWQSFRAPNDRVIHQEPKNGTVWKPWTSCFGTAMVLRSLTPKKEGQL